MPASKAGEKAPLFVLIFSIAEPEFLIENIEVYEEEIKQELGDNGYNELRKISKVDVINFVNSIFNFLTIIITSI